MEVEEHAGHGTEHRYNAQLPYKERIPAERERLLGEIKDSLAKFTVDGDFKLLLQACSGLDRMRQLKYAIDEASTLLIAQSLYGLAFPTEGGGGGGGEELPWRVGNKVMYSLAVLLGKKRSQLMLLGKLVLPWRPMLAALEACALRGFPTGSSMTERQRLITLLQLVGQARRYWGAGEDREIWNGFKAEIARVNAQGAFKALFLFVEFFQSTDSSLYDELLPSWFSLWGQVDHCPAWDGAWLTLLCRARKHASPAFDWTPYMSDIYSFARASIHTPVSVGDAGSAPLMRGRPVAYQYQSFGPPASRSPGVRLNKLSKLMVFLLGKGGPAEPIRVSDVAIVPPAGRDGDGDGDGGNGQRRTVSPGALRLLSLFRSLRTYFHPSNGGRWSLEMGLMVNYTLRALLSRVGAESVLREGGLPTGELSRDDAGLVVDALLPLVLEMVYSKDPSVGSLSNMCLSALASLSPKSVAPAFAELILRALDPVASINHTHQAPAAIRALTSVFRPLMHPRPYLAPYLPALLELTLPGLDSNDVFKTTVTLQLYHLILCWVPVQGSPVSLQALDGWKPPAPAWLDAPSEAEGADEHEHLYTACEGLGGVMMEWSVALLDRLFEILRHKDKSSKVKAGDLASDTMNVAGAMTGTRGGNVGALSAMLGGGGGSEAFLTGLIRVVAQQLFTMADDPAAKMASAKVLRFATDRPLPNVEKDVAAVIETAASARPAKTVAALFPALCDGLLAPSTASGDAPVLAPGASPVLLRWRLQLLSGLARGAGAELAPHGPALRRLISAGISHKDKRVRKGARKLLRKALFGLCEVRSADTRSLPPARWANVHSVAEWRRLCEPMAADELAAAWVEPSREGLALAALLLEDFLSRPMRELTAELAKGGAAEEKLPAGAAAAAGVWREHLKTMDYAFRGGVSLLGDRGTPGEDDDGGDDAASGDRLRDDVYLAVGSRGLSPLLAAEDGPRLYAMVAGLRAEVARFMRDSLEACAREKGPADVKSAKLAVRLSQRVACTRGAKAHETRRKGSAIAAFKSQQREVGRDAARKARLALAREAAAKGDTAVAARLAALIAGSGGAQACPRALDVARASLQHGKRLGVAPRALAFAAKNAAAGRPSSGAGVAAAPRPWPAASAVLDRYRSLFSALVQLSSSEYAMVRAAAQVGVNRVGGVFSWFARDAVPGLIGRLSLTDQPPCAGAEGGGEAAHRRLTGALYLLHQTRSMRHVVSRWSLSRSLLLALCDSQSVLARLPADKQEKAAARVTILFNAYVSYWRSNPLVTDEDRAEYDALLKGLLERLASFSGSAPSAGGGWRYQLLASWCLMHLIRPAVQPPIAVWHYYAECLSRGGDGQPLQRLALGALKRLLSGVADPASPRGSEVSKLLCSEAFLHPLLSALAYNHQKQATEGGLAGGDQWSLGVREVLQDSGRGDTRQLFPRLRFAARSPLFWARNANLVSAVVSAVGDESRAGCVRVLLERANAEKAVAAHEDKRSFDCAAAEVAAGVLAVLAGPSGWSEREEVLRESVLPFAEKALESVSLDGRLDWTDAIRFALDRATPEGCEPLVSMVVERTRAVLQGGGKGRDDYSVLVKWLSFLGAVLIELSGREASIPRASSIAKELCPLLLEGLDHPFKACREEIARNLFLCTHVTDAAWATGMADGVRESILAEAIALEEDGVEKVAGSIATLSVEDATDTTESALLASAMAMSDGSPTAEQEDGSTRAAKHLSLRRESVLQWLHQTAGAGDHVRYLPILVALLPVALQCVCDSNPEVAGMGRGTCLSSAAALTIRSSTKGVVGPDGGLSGAAAGGVMSAVLSAASSDSWRVRRGAAAVACVLQTRLHFVLEDAQHAAVDAALLSLLADARREVQETARLAVSTRVAHLTAAGARELCATFVAGADSAAASRKKRRKIAKRRAAAGEGAAAAAVAVAAGEPSGAVQEQQRNVLGLSAVVLAAPCDVPEWVPGALESLAKHVNDESPGRLPVRQTVTHTFKEFRRTHQDKWEESHKARFSREQLDTFDDVLGGAHSYFI